MEIYNELTPIQRSQFLIVEEELRKIMERLNAIEKTVNTLLEREINGQR